MTLLEVRRKILELRSPILQVSDVAARLNITPSYASKLLSRLEAQGAATRLIGGKWVLADNFDQLEIPEVLTSPAPTYVSLQTALFHHGLVSQVPSTTYAVSVARTRKFNTPIGVFSIHHVEPEFFFGFELYGPRSIKMATPEKALIDVLYLSPARSILFAALPEVELPRSFRIGEAREIISRISHDRRRTHVRNRFEDLLRKAKNSAA